MPLLLLSALGLMLQAQPAWTWTLYEGEGPVVLAEEVPDTPQLRTTLECEPGSGVVRLSLYGPGAEPGFAALRSGDASATGEASVRDGALQTALRADHPVFAGLIGTGVLLVNQGGRERVVQVADAHRAKLRRFAERCG
jgi:hypothetical protein